MIAGEYTCNSGLSHLGHFTCLLIIPSTPLVTVTPVLPNDTFSIQLDSEMEKLLGISHSCLGFLTYNLCNLFGPAGHLDFIMNPCHVCKISIPAMLQPTGNQSLLCPDNPLLAHKRTSRLQQKIQGRMGTSNVQKSPIQAS